MSDTEFVEHADESLSPRAAPPCDNDLPEFVENADNHNSNVFEHTEHAHSEHAEYRRGSASSRLGHDDGSGLRPSLSRRSTIMLDEDELSQLNQGEEAHDEGPLSRAQEGEQVDLNQMGTTLPKDGLVETIIEWKEGGNSVFVTGSFTGWRQMIPLRKFDDNIFVVVLKLAPGTHRLRFVVDGELRCSNSMNAATDSMGNLVNYMEVVAPEGFEQDDLLSDQLESPGHVYTREIPEIFADPEALDKFSSIEFTPPPQLPPHLDGVILNTNWTEKDNNSVLPIPNHVVLNHLATTSIKHNVLAVASVSRYQAKYVTQILYSPIERAQ